MINNAVDELIQEKVKLEKINEYNIKVDEEEYLSFESNFFLRNNIDQSKILSLLKENNIDYQELRGAIDERTFMGQINKWTLLEIYSVSQLEIDEIISKNPNITYDQAKSLVTQRQLDLQSSKLLRDIMNEATIEYR